MSTRVSYNRLNENVFSGIWLLCGQNDEPTLQTQQVEAARQLETHVRGQVEQDMRLAAFGDHAGYNERRNFLMMTRLSTYERWQEWERGKERYRDRKLKKLPAVMPD